MGEGESEAGKYGKQCKVTSYYPSHCLSYKDKTSCSVVSLSARQDASRLDDNLGLKAISGEEGEEDFIFWLPVFSWESIFDPPEVNFPSLLGCIFRHFGSCGQPDPIPCRVVLHLTWEVVGGAIRIGEWLPSLRKQNCRGPAWSPLAEWSRAIGWESRRGWETLRMDMHKIGQFMGLLCGLNTLLVVKCLENYLVLSELSNTIT